MAQTQTHRLALWFSVRGDLRFLSHRDTIRLWQRAFVRAGIPVSYSQGFNPHLLLSLPLPRSVSMTSQKELLIIQLQHRCEVNDFIRQLQKQLPMGLEIISAEYVPGRITPGPCWASYVVSLSSQVDRSALTRRLSQFLQASVWPVWRRARGRHPERNLNLRSYVKQLDMENDILRFTINIDSSGTARIDELLNALDLDEPQMVREIDRSDTGYPPELDLAN